MAKTMTTISMNYNKAKAQAKNLDSIAVQLRTNKVKLEGYKGDIAVAWKGSNANDFLRKLEKVVNNLSKIESNINKIANVVRTNSKRTYDAEVAAISTASKRNYK